MSSVGQALGGIVGGAIGFFVGGPVGALRGAQIGIMAGGLIDPPDGPTINGPRLNDLNVQTATYGAFIPRAYGTVPIVGNVFWVQGDRLIEVKNTSTSGGKGGPQTTTNTWSYFASFAVGLADCSHTGPIDGVRRIWIAGQLWYDAGSDDLSAIIASNEKSDLFTLYLGTDTQDPDPLIQADRGVANTPAYRGRAYLVFDRLPLEKYNNSLAGAQVKAEVVASGTLSGWGLVDTKTDANTTTENFHAVPYCDDAAFYEWTIDAVSTFPAKSDFSIWRVDLLTGERAYVSRVSAAIEHNLGTVGSIGYAPIGYGDVNHLALCNLAPRGITILYPNESSVYSYPVSAGGSSFFISNYALVDNILAYTAGIGAFGANQRLIVHDLRNDVISEYAFPATVDSVLSVAISSGKIFVNTADTTAYIYVFDIATSAWVVNQTLESFTGVTGDSTQRFPWSGNPASEFLFFNVGGRLYRVNTIDYSLEFICLDFTVSYSGSPQSRLFYDASSELFFVRNLADGVPGTNYRGAFSINKITPAATTLSSIISAECLASNLLTSGDIDVTELTDDVRGYRVTQLGAIRGGIDPLRAAWPFDVVQHGYQIKFKRRGSASVATIPSTALDARAAGSAPGVQITDMREMDLMLPRRVDVSYLDATREYDNNTQLSPERTSADSANIRALELPIVFNAAEGAQKAEQLLYLYWMERYDVTLTLPPEYAALEPADVITVTSPGADYELRLVSTNTTPDGRIECRAKYNNAAIYTPVARGEEGQSTGSALTLDGPAVYNLLDIPLMRDDDDTAGFPVAMAGYLSGWPGGVLYRSDDSGQTWADLRAFSPGAVIGFATGTLAAHGGTVIDFASTLSVRLYAGTLSSVTQAQMFAGQNWFAYGAHGRWEIIAAANAVLQVDGSYLLSDFLRGQRGTEWATGLHAVNDRLVLLDANQLAFISVNASTIGASRDYRAITTGKTLDSDASLAFTYAGVNLECLSPVHLTGNRHPSTNDWTLTWTRRSRFDQWRDYVDTPLGEAAESYEIDIFSSGTYTTLKRTLTASTPTVAYTSAQQVTDFGSNQATLYVKVYQLSATVGRGYALTQSITR